MSTPEEGSPAPRSNHPRYVFKYTCDGKGEAFAEGVARRRTRSALAGDEPKVEVAYDRSRQDSAGSDRFRLCGVRPIYRLCGVRPI